MFNDPAHNWKSKGGQWKGDCPWHHSDSGTCFTVDPETKEWYCFHCERGGGPARYLYAENGGEGTPKGGDFVQVVKALAERAGVSVPESEDDPSSARREQRSPHRSERDRSEARRKTPAGFDSKNVLPAGGSQPNEPDLEVPESDLREALLTYREALKKSTRARSYVESRGLSVEILYQHGCGFAAPGEWVQDDVTNEKGNHIHRAPNGRIVTPHTTVEGTLVSLCGRAVPPCPEWLRKRHVAGNPTGLFNASIIGREDRQPIVFCEGPMDALSFIEKGWERALALHGTSGVPWEALRSTNTLVFAFDNDNTGQEDVRERAHEAVLRGHEAHVLPGEEGAYGGKEDPNEALQAGTLDLSPLVDLAEGNLGGESRSPERFEPTDEVEAGGSAESGGNDLPGNPGQERTAWPVAEWIEGDCDPDSLKELTLCSDEQQIGYLGRWSSTTDFPTGPIGEGLYADRSLYKWIFSELEKGPGGAEDIERLRWVLWRLYAAYGPEDVPEWQVPTPPDSETGGTQHRIEPGGGNPYDLGSVPEAVDTWRTEAPTPCRASPVGRGIALDAPFDESFINDLKSSLPTWCRKWRPEEKVWVVDDMVASFVGALLRCHFE